MKQRARAWGRGWEIVLFTVVEARGRAGVTDTDPSASLLSLSPQPSTLGDETSLTLLHSSVQLQS